MDVIKRLAEFDPMHESYQGDTTCIFCGAWEGAHTVVVHEKDCLWLEAKNIIEHANDCGTCNGKGYLGNQWMPRTCGECNGTGKGKL